MKPSCVKNLLCFVALVLAGCGDVEEFGAYEEELQGWESGDQNGSVEEASSQTALSTQAATGAPEFYGFRLVDASNGNTVSEYRNMNGNVSINLSTLPSSLAMYANVGGGHRSFVFRVNGRVHRTENVVPYAINGDAGNYVSYTPYPFAQGTTTFSGQAYSGTNGSGSASAEISLTLTVSGGDGGGGGGGSPARYSQRGALLIKGASNQTYSNLRITNPNGPCVEIINSTGITIKNSYIGPCGNGRNLDANGVYVVNSQNVEIRDTYIKDSASGAYVVGSSQIRFHHNHVRNVKGPFPRGQMIQFNGVTGYGNSIEENILVNVLGRSVPEDAVNLYASHGTSSSPIRVHRNYVRGGGPSRTGGGLMSGDHYGSWQELKDNILVDPGQYGIAIAGGHNIVLQGNQVYGKQQYFTNVGAYVWGQFGYTGASGCGNHQVFGNTLYWVNSKGSRNEFWNGGNCVNTWFDFNQNKRASSYQIPAVPSGWGPSDAVPSDFES